MQDSGAARAQAAALLPGGSLEPVIDAVERCLHFYITAGGWVGGWVGGAFTPQPQVVVRLPALCKLTLKLCCMFRALGGKKGCCIHIHCRLRSSLCCVAGAMTKSNVDSLSALLASLQQQQQQQRAGAAGGGAAKKAAAVSPGAAAGGCGARDSDSLSPVPE